MIQTTATIIAIVETQMMTVSIFYPLPAAYSHRQTSIPKNAATDTPNHATGSQPQMVTKLRSMAYLMHSALNRQRIPAMNKTSAILSHFLRATHNHAGNFWEAHKTKYPRIVRAKVAM